MTHELITDEVRTPIVEPRQFLYDHEFVVVGVSSKHEMLPSISHREARLRIVAWHQQLANSAEIE
jgi:hypothetical protein